MYTVKNPEAFDAIAELGMGYHFGTIVDEKHDGDEQGVIVLNGQYALRPDEILNHRSFEKLLWEFGRSDAILGVTITMIASPKQLPERSILPNDNISLFMASFGRFILNSPRFEARIALHASPPFPLITKSQENFARFSAFKKDRRVQLDGSLLPGTYVTSERDAQFGSTGYGVVGRYALPNIMPATNRFDILVPIGTPGLVGTVSPAFGQAGGGVEVEFTEGTPLGSVTRHSTIPEY